MNRSDANHRQEPVTEPPVSDNFAETLLAYESEVRTLSHEQELFAHAVNSTRRLFPFRQALLFGRSSSTSSYSVIAASSLSFVDRNSPQIRWFESIVRRLGNEMPINEIHSFSLPSYCDDSDEETHNYPFSEFLWAPFVSGDKTFGGLLFTRDQGWSKAERLLIKRTARLYGHAWSAIKGQKQLLSKPLLTRTTLLASAVVLCSIAFIPISITALAPVEVVPAKPFVVAAPFDGVVKEILVDKNQWLNPGDPIIAFEDVRLRNEYEIADQNYAVAKAKLLSVSQSAISDKTAKRELTISEAELALAKAERDYAADLLNKAVVKASRNGIAIYTDKRDWVGRPVAAGEAIIQIANPTEIEFEVYLPVKDSLVLKEGARVKIFLDSDPLKPLQAVLTEAGYQAQKDKRDILSYKITARLQESIVDSPRIGIQGTAQVYSDKAPLIYVLLRRPLSTLRQFTGW